MKHDYDLTELKKIKVRGLNFNVMPRYLYHYTDKEYEEFSLDLLDRLVKEGGTAIDIGAHYGIYSLLAAKKSKKVHAFEPVPENYEILKKNIHDNKFDSVIEATNMAVSDEKGEVEFNITWASDSAGFYTHPNAEVIRKIKVQTNSIDNQLKNVQDVSFIKIDTEGHEIHVLDGMKKTLKNNPSAIMLIEFNPQCLQNAGTSTRALIDKILSLQYDIFALHEETRHIVRVTEAVSDEQILQGRTYLNLLCLPRGSWDNPLFVSHSSEIGGAELVLYETINALLKRTDKFIFPTAVLPGSGPLAEKLAHLGMGLEVIPFDGWVYGGLRDAGDTERLSVNGDAIIGLTKIADDTKPSVVVTNTMTVPWGALVASALGIPHVWSIHEFGDKDHGFTFDYGFVKSLGYINQLSARVIVNSKAVYNHVKKYINTDKLRYVPLEVATPILPSEKVRSVFSASATIKLAVVSGSITVAKGQLEAVKALKELRDAGHRAELLLVGRDTSEYATKVKVYVEQHNLTSSVHFIGFVDHPGVYTAMADVYVMPSRSEAFGRVTVEAMLLGKPVVGANSGATADIVTDGRTGYLYTPGNSHELANKILQLVESGNVKVFGKNAKEFAKNNYQAEYAAAFYNELRSATSQHTETREEPSLFRDVAHNIVLASGRKDEKIATLQEQYRRDIKIYSDDYNKVYEAYHGLERRLEAIYAHPVVKVLKKFKRI